MKGRKEGRDVARCGEKRTYEGSRKGRILNNIGKEEYKESEGKLVRKKRRKEGKKEGTKERRKQGSKDGRKDKGII